MCVYMTPSGLWKSNGGLSLGRRLLGESQDAPGAVEPRHADVGRLRPGHRHNGEGHVGPGRAVRPQELAEVHAVELVAREDEHVAADVFVDVADVLAHGV